MKTYSMNELEKVKNISFSTDSLRKLNQAKANDLLFNSFYPSFFEVRGEFYIPEGEETPVFLVDRIIHFLNSEICKIEIRAINQHNKTYYHIMNFTNFKTLSSWEKEKAKEGLKEPQNIGVLTAKKIKNWVDYVEAKFLKYSEKEQQNENKISAFYESLKNENVFYWNDKQKGEVKKNGLIFKFEISGSYISTETVLETSRNLDINTFNQFANNNFKN